MQKVEDDDRCGHLNDDYELFQGVTLGLPFVRQVVACSGGPCSPVVYVGHEERDGFGVGPLRQSDEPIPQGWVVANCDFAPAVVGFGGRVGHRGWHWFEVVVWHWRPADP